MTLPLSIMWLENEGQEEALAARGAFTDMTQEGAKAWPASQVALLLRRDEELGIAVTEIGTVTRSPQRVATGWHRLRYLRQHEIEKLALEELTSEMPPRLRGTIGRRRSFGGVLSEKGAEAAATAFARLRPRDADVLQRLRGTDERRTPTLQGAGLQAAAQEADAVRLAIDIAGLPRTVLRDVHPNGESSFLARLETVRAPEDTAIAYDAMRFLDFDRIDSPSGIASFERGQDRLVVVNVNRQPLERTTGADLIYINEPRQTVVLVQYKTMRREGGQTPRLIYRPDSQFEAELERMRAIAIGADDGTPASYRLHPGSCFLKLCTPVVRLERTSDLVSGMYLPLDYYDVLAASPLVRGPRDGVAFTYGNVDRHIGNDLFVGLVRGGWVGSRGAATRQLQDLIIASLNADRSVTIAAASRTAITRNRWAHDEPGPPGLPGWQLEGVPGSQ